MRKFCLLIISLWGGKGFSQNLHNGQVLIPNEASINKFIDFPVDKSTGIPDIDIPLYTITDGDFKIPISVSYHSAGIKVEEMASNVGLGWSLNAGGEISRQIKGWPDEMGYFSNRGPVPFPVQVEQFDESGNMTAYENKMCTCSDTQPDLFYFNIPGYSGKFVFDINRVARLIPEQDIKVEVLDNDFNNWKITTADGSQYFFSSSYKDTYEEYSGDYTDAWVYGWYLNKIISPSGRIFLFTYVEDGGLQQKVLSHPSAIVGQGYLNWTPHPTFTEDKIGNKIKSIKSDLLDVEFNYSTTLRQDYGNASGALSTATALNNIMIKNNKSGALIKQFNFTTSYFISNEPSTSITGVEDYEKKRLRLDAIQECGKNGSCLPPYQFFYNKNNPTPNNWLPDRLSYTQDVWGYFNGAWNNINLFPSELKTPNGATTLYTFYPNTKDPDENYSKAFILDEITFPTGGVTSFFYEGNKATATSPDLGGLRIKEIKRVPGNSGLPIITDFVYENPVIIGGYPQFTAVISDGENGVNSSVSDYFPDNNCNENSSQFLSGKYWAFSSPTVTFGQVTSQYLYYGKVTEKNSNNGSVESYYNVDDLNEETTDFNNSYYPAFSTYPLLNAGKLIKEIYKDNNGNAIKENDFTYEKNEKLVECGNAYILFQPFCIQRTLSLSESTGYSYLTQKNEITFGKTYPTNPDDYLIKTTKYDYANAFGSDYPDHHFVEKQTVTESNGSSSIENMRYPLDYTISGSITNSIAQGIQNLQNNHIIAPVVEKYSQRLNGSILTTTEALFYTYKPTVSLPDVVYKLQSSSPLSSFLPTTISNTSVTMNSNYKPEIQFDSYGSYNNLFQQHKFNDNNKAYLWDYNYKYPVAIVENAIQSDIAYSSFEADDKGNWSFSGTSQPVADAPTGKYVMQLSGSNSISKSGLVSGTTYIVTYWAKGGSAYANGAAGEAMLAKGDWTLYKNTLTGISSVIISGNSIIDELRLYPTTAQMTTYTYEPLIGMTSQCDPNSRITYYDYDPFGRLMLVKDQDGNILKKYCYNYAGQAGQCNLYESDAINADYDSRNCGSESAVPYHVSVPQGMFTSYIDLPTANELAQQYAQNQANQYGTCQVTNASIYVENSHGIPVTIQLHNNGSGQDYSFTAFAHVDGIVGSVPPGNYDITLTPSQSGYYYYSVGCGYYSDSGDGITFYGVDISTGCSSISID